MGSSIKLPMQFFKSQLLEPSHTALSRLRKVPSQQLPCKYLIPGSITVGNRGLDLFIGAFENIEFRLREQFYNEVLAKLCEFIQQDKLSMYFDCFDIEIWYVHQSKLLKSLV